MSGRSRASLPVEMTTFVGRRTEVRAVADLVREHRLVTLVGPGGVGKTRLATQAGRLLTERFSEGVWFTDLSLTSRPDLVPALVAEPFDVGDIGTALTRPMAEVLADYFSDDQLLLILDNCEHLPQAVVQLATALLDACPRLNVLATSRHTLDIPGEIVYRVSPLGLGREGSGSSSEAVELFVDRLTLVDASRHPDEAEIETIAAIVERLDGLPLAIELAASRTKLLSPSEILERLSDRFHFLTGGSGRPERQETLLATMEWSYELLIPADRQALDRLSVFKGWTLEAAEAVLGSSAADHLERLVDSSLVDVKAGDATSRYRMLETVRQYGLERLREAGAEDQARLAHASYHLDLASRSDVGLRSAEQAAWLERMRPEHDNIRAALGWTLDTDRADLALQLVAATGRFWFMQTHWSEALGWLARAADLAGDRHDLLWARAFIKTGIIELITQGVPVHPTDAVKANEILTKEGDAAEQALATYAMAEWSPDAKETTRLNELSLRLASESGDAWVDAFVHRWQGSKVELVGDPRATSIHQREAVAGFGKLGDHWTAGWMAFDLGFSLLGAEAYPEAMAAFEEALEFVDGIDDRLVEAHATRGLAAVAAGTNRNEEAARLYLDALPRFERIGDVTCLSFSRMFLAEVEAELQPGADVGGRLREALAGFRSVRHDAGTAAVYRRFSRQALAAGDTAVAARIFGAAMASRGGSRGELVPRETSAFDRLVVDLERAADPDEVSAWMDDGATITEPELLATVAALDTGERGAPSLQPEPEPAPTMSWREAHRTALEHMEAAWGLRDDVHVYRSLGGKSGASVLAVDISTTDFSGQAILKLEEGDWSVPAEIEAERHEQAWGRAPEFAELHMPRVVHRGRWGRSSALLATIASRGLEYTVPWAEAPYGAQLDVGTRMASELLAHWNSDYRLGPSIVSPQSLLGGWLDYRLDPERGRIHAFLEQHGVDPESPTYIHDGQWYPNPLAFAHDPATGEKRGLRPIVGNTHGDLHGYNVLVRTGVEQPPWFLIDLAFYDPDGFLFFDHAYFELAHLLESRALAPIGDWMPLLDGLGAHSDLRSDDFGLVELLRSLRAAAWTWVETEEPDRVSSMQSQLILARVAAGLNFTHKRVPESLKSRSYLYAAASLKDYVKLHFIDWPRKGPTIDFD